MAMRVVLLVSSVGCLVLIPANDFIPVALADKRADRS